MLEEKQVSFMFSFCWSMETGILVKVMGKGSALDFFAVRSETFYESLTEHELFW